MKSVWWGMQNSCDAISWQGAKIVFNPFPLSSQNNIHHVVRTCWWTDAFRQMCTHKRIQQMTERLSQKRTERYSTLALAAQVNELEQEERKTPANTCWLHCKPSYAQQVLPSKFSRVLRSDTNFKYFLSVSKVSDVQGRLLVSMLRCSEVWATTIFLNSESLASSCCFGSTHYLDVSNEVWSKFRFNRSSLSAHHVWPLRKKSTKVLEKCIKTYQGIKRCHHFHLCIYLELWSIDRVGRSALSFS